MKSSLKMGVQIVDPLEFGMPFGFEIEFYVCDGQESPVDLTDELSDELNHGLEKRGVRGTFTADAGRGQWEAALGIFGSMREAKEAIAGMKAALFTVIVQRGWRAFFCATQPAALRNFGWISLPRLEAIKQALQIECPANWHRVLETGARNAVHVTMGIPPLEPEGLLVVGFSNLSGPWVTPELAQLVGEDCRGFQDFWKGGWARRERFSDPSRYCTGAPEQYADYVASVTKLISPYEILNVLDTIKRVGWLPDLETPMNFHELASQLSGYWWQSRHKSYEPTGAIEQRRGVSGSLDRVHYVVECELSMARALIDIGRGRLFAERQDLAPVFKEMNRRFAFLPDFVPNQEQYHMKIVEQTI